MMKRDRNSVAIVQKQQSISMWLGILMLGALSLILFSFSNTVFAHAALVKAEPARRAVLSVPPKQVKLWFNEDIEGDYASLSILNADSKPVTERKPLVDPEDPKSIFMELPELEAGRYTAKFRVLSVDGHVVDSDYKFTVKQNSVCCH